MDGNSKEAGTVMSGTCSICRHLLAFAALVLLAGAAGCAGLNGMGEVMPGRVAMLSNCSECHRIFMPEEYTKEEWAPILDRMLPLVSLDKEEKMALRAYILRNSR